MRFEIRKRVPLSSYSEFRCYKVVKGSCHYLHKDGIFRPIGNQPVEDRYFNSYRYLMQTLQKVVGKVKKSKIIIQGYPLFVDSK